MASVARIAAVDPRFEAENADPQAASWPPERRQSNNGNNGRPRSSKQRPLSGKSRYANRLSECEQELRRAKAMVRQHEEEVSTLESLLAQSRSDHELAEASLYDERARRVKLDEDNEMLRSQIESLLAAAGLAESGDLQEAYLSLLVDDKRLRVYNEQLKRQLTAAKSLVSATLADAAVTAAANTPSKPDELQDFRGNETAATTVDEREDEEDAQASVGSEANDEYSTDVNTKHPETDTEDAPIDNDNTFDEIANNNVEMEAESSAGDSGARRNDVASETNDERVDDEDGSLSVAEEDSLKEEYRSHQLETELEAAKRDNARLAQELERTDGEINDALKGRSKSISGSTSTSVDDAAPHTFTTSAVPNADESSAGPNNPEPAAASGGRSSSSSSSSSSNDNDSSSSGRASAAPRAPNANVDCAGPTTTATSAEALLSPSSAPKEPSHSDGTESESAALTATSATSATSPGVDESVIIGATMQLKAKGKKKEKKGCVIS